MGYLEFPQVSEVEQWLPYLSHHNSVQVRPLLMWTVVLSAVTSVVFQSDFTTDFIIHSGVYKDNV